MVVGKLGKYLAENYKLGHKIFYFDLNDEKPEEETIKEIIDFVKRYERIIVFHGKFETVLNQNPAITDISGGISPEEQTEEVKDYFLNPRRKRCWNFLKLKLSAIFSVKRF